MMIEPIKLSEAAGILVIVWFALLSCWEDFVMWWQNKNDE